MKRLLFVAMFLPTIGIAQSAKERRLYLANADTVAFPVPFAFTFIDSCGANKSLIWSRSVEWLANHLSNYKSGAQVQDSAAGKIVIPDVKSQYNDSYCYTITIDVRQGKFRCVFSNFYELRENVGKVPFDTIAQIKMVYLGPGTKHQYWQAEKLHEREEAAAIFGGIQTNVGKKDDF